MADITVEQRLLQQINIDITLISDDISDKRPLGEAHYHELIFGIRNRTHEHESKMSSLPIPEGLEDLDVLSQEFEIPAVEDASLLSSLWSNLLRLVSFKKLERKLTLNEKLLVGLCIAALLLSITSFVVGFPFMIGIGLSALGIVIASIAVVKEVISLIKMWQSYRVTRDELKHASQHAETLKLEIDQFNADIKSPPPNKKPVDSSTLRSLADRYIIEGYKIHRLSNKLHQPHRLLGRRIQVSAGIIALIGAIFIFIPPLTIAGGVIMAIAGITAMGAAFNNWKHRQHETQSLSPQDAKDIREKRREPQTPNEQRYAEILTEHNMWATPTPPSQSAQDKINQPANEEPSTPKITPREPVEPSPTEKSPEPQPPIITESPIHLRLDNITEQHSSVDEAPLNKEDPEGKDEPEEKNRQPHPES